LHKDHFYVDRLLSRSQPHYRPSTYLIVLAIKSIPNEIEKRHAIRETWGNKLFWNKIGKLNILGPKLVTIKLLFLIGISNFYPTSDIKAENNQSDDILMGDFSDSFQTLSLKDHLMFNYLDKNCSEVDFLFKGDDDILLNPIHLLLRIKSFILEQKKHSFGVTVVNQEMNFNYTVNVCICSSCSFY
jgi:hypothetical protein